MMKPINSPEFADVVAVSVNGRRVLDPAGIDIENGIVEYWVPALGNKVDVAPGDNVIRRADSNWTSKQAKGKVELLRKKR